MSLKASIDIAAPPAAVRAKFLDFAALPSYTRAFESIASPRPGTELAKGDSVTVKLANSPAFTGVIQQNTPALFSWTGSLPFIFTGTHQFRFEPSEKNPGGTLFVQEEAFSGALSPLMGENLVARGLGFREKTRAAWEGFNADLKGVCEREAAGTKA
ncbi:hypothetical protein B5807_10741 [Epicoccum nigrum]|uniref:Activator of Hsp90 ATPase N-terminal domain-containing protein n=1 Tax=Epicoccum nigrum TaxID=105696 RepID=A0A1Y2LM03_EPING|nr:hypothetical protein B5807_10741 [Epicoccum nigrum]